MIYTTLSPKPLFDWFAEDKTHRARFREAGYSDGRITNWKRRGIPRAEIGNIAMLMGLTYEQYVITAEAAERKHRAWRRAAAFLVCAIFAAPQQSDASRQPQSVFPTATVYYVKRRLGLARIVQAARRAISCLQLQSFVRQALNRTAG